MIFNGWRAEGYSLLIPDGGNIDVLQKNTTLEPTWIISKNIPIYWQYAPNKWYPISNIKIKNNN